MKKALFFITNAICALLIAGITTSCLDEIPVEKPTISLKAVNTGIDYLDFTITPENAEQVAWVCIKSTESLPAADMILANGTSADAKKASSAKAENLQPETEYTIIAAARNSEEIAVSEALKMTTNKEGKPEVIEVTLTDATAETNVEEAEAGIYTILFSSADNTEILLTFRAEAGDRLPAGEYRADQNLDNIIIRLKGDSNAITPESGSVKAELKDEDYTFTMDFTLNKDRILKAGFTGKVKGYPLEKKPIVTDLDMMYIFESGYYTSASYPDVAQYTFDISDMEFKTNGDPAGNAKAFQLVIYGVQGPNEEYIGLPAGEYSLKQTAYMENGKFTAVYKEYDKDGFTDVEKYFTEGTLTITDEGSCLLELSVTDKDGNVINTTFEGEVAFKNPNYKPEEPEPNFTCTGSYNDRDQDFMFYFTGKDGSKIEIDIYFDTPTAGGLPAGTYHVGSSGAYIVSQYTTAVPAGAQWYEKYYASESDDCYITVGYDAENDMVTFDVNLTFDNTDYVMRDPNLKFKSDIKIITTEPEPESEYTCTNSINSGNSDFMFYFTDKAGNNIEIDIILENPADGGLPAGTYYVGYSGDFIDPTYTIVKPAGAQWYEKHYVKEDAGCYIKVDYDAENDMVVFDVNLSFENGYEMKDSNLKFKSNIKII